MQLTAAGNRRVVFIAPGEVRLVEEPVAAPGPGKFLVETHRTLVGPGTEPAYLAGPPWTNPGQS